MKEKLTDESIMPFGTFKDKKMANVPAWYLYSFYNNNVGKILYGNGKNVFIYVKDNLDTIEADMDKEQENRDTRRNLRYR